MEARKCDRCHKYYDIEEEKLIDKNGYEYVLKYISIRSHSIDLCQECFKGFLNWLDGVDGFPKDDKSQQDESDESNDESTFCTTIFTLNTKIDDIIESYFKESISKELKGRIKNSIKRYVLKAGDAINLKTLQYRYQHYHPVYKFGQIVSYEPLNVNDIEGWDNIGKKTAGYIADFLKFVDGIGKKEDN